MASSYWIFWRAFNKLFVSEFRVGFNKTNKRIVQRPQLGTHQELLLFAGLMCKGRKQLPEPRGREMSGKDALTGLHWDQINPRPPNKELGNKHFTSLWIQLNQKPGAKAALRRREQSPPHRAQFLLLRKFQEFWVLGTRNHRITEPRNQCMKAWHTRR